LIAVLGAFVLAPGFTTSGDSDKPDLVALLPTAVDATQVAPEYVDAYAVPGRLVYRFDSVIWNQGGLLELYRDSASDEVMQVVWPGGTPTAPPDPNSPPSDASAQVENRSPFGALLEYALHGTHQHWHFLSAARYDLLVAGGSPRTSEKVGFCLRDTYGTLGYYAGGGTGSWCKPGDPDADFVGMGISSGAGDRYRSQVFDQWIDVTELAPGPYVLRVTVNPLGAIAEANTANNVATALRMIPGTAASSLDSAVPANRSTDVALAGTVIAPAIPARTSAACDPSPTSTACYVAADAEGPLAFAIDERPQHGSVEITSSEGRGAVAVYTPEPAFTGRDSFTYRVTDVRGLTSRPAVVFLTVFRLALSSSRGAVVYGKRAELSGRAHGLSAGERIAVSAQRYGGERARIAEATTDEVGRWSLPVRPRIQTAYWAEYGGETSRAVLVQVRPRVTLVEQAGRLRARVAPGLSGRTVWLQRWSKTLERWRFVEPRRLNGLSAATFAERPRGRVRAYIGARAAGPGYLAGWSRPIRLNSG
jgi:hypothetical protein